MENAAQQPTCSEKIEPAWKRRRTAIDALLTPEDHAELIDDGTLDTVISIDGEEYRFSQDEAADYRDANGCLDLEVLIAESDTLRDDLDQQFSEYALAFDWVAPGTSENQPRGYYRYLISCGGPSEEIRFYCDIGQPTPDRIEFWYFDFTDSACKDITNDTVASRIWDRESCFAEAMRSQS